MKLLLLFMLLTSSVVFAAGKCTVEKIQPRPPVDLDFTDTTLEVSQKRSKSKIVMETCM